MEHSRQSNGWQTFLENWGLLLTGVAALLTSQVLSFFTRLTGAPWIWWYGIGLTVAAVGVALIFNAKLPLCRQRRFFTFGSRALPESRRPYYRWGYRCSAFAAALLLGLLLSKP
jgi:hypothetical protein